MNGSVRAASPQPPLHEILDLIVNASRSETDLSPADRQLRKELRLVVAQYPGQPLTLEPALISLVHIVTGRMKLLTDAQHSQVTHAVARTLFDDSGSRRRLESLWKSLQESES